MAPKRYRDNLSDYDTDLEDLNVESVGEILDGFEANVFDSNGEKVKILQGRHKTLKTQQMYMQRDPQNQKGDQEGLNLQQNVKARAKQDIKEEMESSNQ